MPYTNVIHVTDLQLPELELYSRFSENQLLHYYEPAPGIFIAESPIVAGRALDAGYDPISVLVEEGEVHGSSAAFINRCGDIPVYTASMEVLTQITGFALTRGFCVQCAAATFLLLRMSVPEQNALRFWRIL